MKKLTILILASMTIISCSFRGFKPAPDASAHWRLHKWANPYDTNTNEGFNAYADKQLKDFRDCGIDPYGGSYSKVEEENVYSEAGGYLCIERKGWYYTKGPICIVNWRFFDEPECIEWRKQRGLMNAPRPKKYTY